MADPVIRDPRGEALAYLEQHKLLRLFNILGAKLACEKPDNPNAYLLSELSKASVMQARGQPVRSASTITICWAQSISVNLKFPRPALTIKI
jgi:hypothetical protein